MKVAHLTTRHVRDDIRVFYKMACSTAKKFDCYLVVFDGFGNEVRDNVNIVDVGSRQGSFFTKLCQSIYRTIKISYSINADIYQIHDPELIPVALFLKAKGKSVIYDMHEHNAKQIIIKPAFGSEKMRRIISKLYYFFETSFICFFDQVYVPQICMCDEFSKYNKNTFVIPNFPSIDELHQVCCQNKRKKIIYSGAITEQRGVVNILELLDHLDDTYELHLCGNVDNSLLVCLEQHRNWNRVIFHGRLGQEQLARVYGCCGIGLIPFNNVGQYHMAYSLKLFEYMKYGMTVIMPNFGDWIPFNEKFNVGYNVQTDNSLELANAILQINDEKFESFFYHNIELAKTEFNWGIKENELLSKYMELIE